MSDPNTTPPTTRVERSAGGGDGFAGLPTTPATPIPDGSRRVSAGSALPAGLLRPEMLQQERDYVQFELPEKVMGLAWSKSGYGPEHRTFALVELTPEEEDRAVSLAGQGVKIQQSYNEMVKASIWMIAGERVKYEAKERWLKAIGPRARKVLERCFNELNSIEEAAGESVLATATPGRG